MYVALKQQHNGMGSQQVAVTETNYCVLQLYKKKVTWPFATWVANCFYYNSCLLTQVFRNFFDGSPRSAVIALK